MIPKGLRKYIYSIYAFARYADDIADSGTLGEQEKICILSSLEECISNNALLNRLNKNENMILTALLETRRKFNIDKIEFLNLLSAFRQDSINQKYYTFNELIDYSSRSANPIGHLILNVFGYKKVDSPDLFRYSDCVCTALQLTNFWQDVSVDIEIGRIYIPEEEMIKFDYNYEYLLSKNENDNFRRLMKDLTVRTRKLFDEGLNIVKLLNGRLRYEIKATCRGGLDILGKIENINYNVLSERVSLSGFEKVKLIIKSII